MCKVVESFNMLKVLQTVQFLVLCISLKQGFSKSETVGLPSDKVRLLAKFHSVPGCLWDHNYVI